VVHCASLGPNDGAGPSAARFARTRTLGYDSLVRLLRGVQGTARVDVVTNHVDDVPEKAILRAPVMVAAQEHPNLGCRLIETDLDPERRDELIAQLVAELTADGRDPRVAYRRGDRLFPAYEPVTLEPAPAIFRQRGVYMITGGLGGVGMVLARHLAERVKARLALVGRSAPDDARRRRIASLEALGAEVMVI